MTAAKPPTPLTDAGLQDALTAAVVQLDVRDLAEHDRPEIERILQENWRRGRMQKFLRDGLDSVPEYVLRVVGYWRISRETVRALQIERADEIWQALYKKMVFWNYRYLVGRGAYLPDTHDFAEECATEAIPVLQSAYFPFDVPFEAWARVIVINVCRKQVRTATKKSVIPQDQLIELDAMAQEPASRAPWQPDLRLDLAQALLELNPARREVMEMIYMEGHSVEEAARILGRTHSSVYNLHYQAVRDLRKLMHNWIKDE